MENATDALYMAFAVLAFVIAISVSIIAFGQVTEATQTILYEKDRTTTYAYINPTEAARKVKREDIIPTLYRAYKENYIVRFEGAGLTDKLYEIKDLTAEGGYRPTSTIDLEGQSIGNAKDANEFMKALLAGKSTFEGLDKVRFSYFKDYLQTRPLYDILEEKTFTEELGVFYQEDRINSGDPTEATASDGVDDVNKTQKRIITYTAN